ncbi:MAG: hypothetical protein K1X55_09085 [Chitinophagales bacterium]|nr:hypothetical protein [Chitinophagales bacterium]
MIQYTIQPEMKLEDFKHWFRGQFEGLKIEFFTQGHGVQEPSVKSNMIKDVHLTLGEVFHVKESFHISIDANTTVGDFEQYLRKHADIHVQIFRKAGHEWLETIITDNKTIFFLNRKAIEDSRPLAQDEPLDYHEQE